MFKKLEFEYKNRFAFPKNASEGITPQVVSDFRKFRKLPLPNANDKICYAPFKSIYFGHGGKAIACCYNRNYILGVYPTESIKEIWFGPKANQLRDFISNYDLSNGCGGCLQMLTAGNFDAVKAKQYDDHKLNRNKFPSVMEFELSNECNLGCIMCNGEFSSYIRKHIEGKEAIVSNYNAEFVNQLREFIPFLQETKYYGGEPFLIPLYLDIWDLIMELNPKCRISVQTNATNISERVKKLLEKGNFHINISFDSLQKDRYESIRRNANYEKVMDNIIYLRDYTRRKKTFFGISACMMRNNWDEAADFIRFCNSINAKVYFHTIENPQTLALHNLTHEELEKMYQKMSAETLEGSNEIQKANIQHYQHWLLQLKGWMNKTKQYDFHQFIAALRSRVTESLNPGNRANLLQKIDALVATGVVDEFKKTWTKEEIESKNMLDNVLLIIDTESTDKLVEQIRNDNR